MKKQIYKEIVFYSTLIHIFVEYFFFLVKKTLTVKLLNKMLVYFSVLKLEGFYLTKH